MAQDNGLGFNFKLKGQTYVLSLLGNLQGYYSQYVSEVINNAPKIVEKIAVDYFRSKSRSKVRGVKGSSPFERTNITASWCPAKYKTVKVETWSDKLWDYIDSYKKDWVVNKQTVNIMFNPENYIVQWYLHGTKPHLITARPPLKFLMFYWDKVKDLVVFKKVHHPGARAHLNAYKTIQNRSYKAIKSFIEKKKIMHGVGMSRLERYLNGIGFFRGRK